MLKRFLLLTLSITLGFSTFSQCLKALDGNGVFDSIPEFISCTPATPNNYTIYIQPDRNMGNYTIVWGDGSPNTNGAIF